MKQTSLRCRHQWFALLVLAVLVASACAPSQTVGDSSQTSTSLQPSDASESTLVAEIQNGLGSLEVSRGPASTLHRLDALLPDSDDLGDDWQRWPFPVLDVPSGCGIVEYESRVAAIFLTVSETSIVGSEMGFWITGYSSIEAAAEELAWLNGDLADGCDELLRPELAERLKRQTAGAYSLADDIEPGVAAESPLSNTPFAGEPTFEAPSDRRIYELRYVGQNEVLEVVSELTAVQVGRYVIMVQRGAGADVELPSQGMPQLLAMGERLLELGEIEPDPAVDALGDQARQSVDPDVLPERFEVTEAAVLQEAESFSGCDSPDPGTALFHLAGPSWWSLQNRSSEFLTQNVLAFETATAAETFLDSVRSDGLACLEEVPVWEDDMFVDRESNWRLEERWLDGVDQPIEVLVVASSANQQLADLKVGVEFLASYVQQGHLVFLVQYGGLAGDGDFAIDLAAEASQRALR